MKKFKIEKSAEEWKAQLGEESYFILREKGTERAFSGALNTNYEKGSYNCKGCNATLFTSEQKFDSGCGWPSFDASEEGSIIYNRDTSHGMIRTEILCANCGGHLGHVFNDGPTETGQRYCVNSLSINFKK
ncbi:peptide-methionine (R)-S-oxide reductase MsrB [Aquimarina agarilytica]|uniref:peptide-methionine (R)-S-oxide reductase MsrB n=1 Tax=Aquimarina agarilytica TaxID=1087449 RepID=UPI0002884515|nr:peptide-methionine (R)-S-oxide reductase MsrB [Aquimarina agarilytica]